MVGKALAQVVGAGIHPAAVSQHPWRCGEVLAGTFVIMPLSF
ncbi:MAG: hypothetical protein Q4B08_13670 [Propionibacteriaceae bacterium]|nr:hypothetical protein [Propionibacteriaceae bacterium]